MALKLKPLADRVVIEPSDDQATTSPGGIIIPDTAKEKPHMAEVVGLSNIENAEIVVGDTVLFKEYAGTETEFEGKKYLILPYADVLAKVVETESI